MARPPGNDGQAIDLLYQPAQQRFLNALRQRTDDGLRWAYDRVGLFSGRRGGKTRCGAIAANEKAARPNTYGWICAPTYKDLCDFVMPAFFAVCPESWIEPGGWSETLFTLRLRGNSTVCFRSLDDPETARGPGLDWAWIDEARKVVPQAYETMKPALMDKKGQVWVTTSPNGWDWTYRQFWQPAEQGIPGHLAIRFKSQDNPIIDPDEVARIRMGMDPLFAAQELDAEFVTFTGAVYGNLIDPQIVTGLDTLKKLIPEWPHIRADRRALMGLDPGADHPFAGVLFVSTATGFVAVGEYLERNRPIQDHIAGLKRLCYAHTGGRPLEPEIWAIDRSQRQMVTELAHHGIYTTPAPNQVRDGIVRVQHWLAARQLWFPLELVPKTIDQMRNYRWADNIKPDGQTRTTELVWKEHDDLADCCRYAMMSWPELPPDLPLMGGSERPIDDYPEAIRWQIARQRACRDAALKPKASDAQAAFAVEDGIGVIPDFWEY